MNELDVTYVVRGWYSEDESMDLASASGPGAEAEAVRYAYQYLSECTRVEVIRRTEAVEVTFDRESLQ